MNDEAGNAEKEWIGRTLLDVREGTCTPEEMEKLRTLLANHPSARQEFLRWNQLDCLLEMSRMEPAAQALPPVRRRTRGYWLAGLAGAGLAACIALLLMPRSGITAPSSTPTASEAPLAALMPGRDTVIGGKTVAAPRELEKGALALDQGIAQLAFRNGAKIVLEGGCGFEIVNESTVILKRGKMWAYCPFEARGFRVLTPGGAEVVDLGTEFGIEVGNAGETKVHVFDGLVDVAGPATGERRLEAGAALGWSDKPNSVTVSHAEPDRFTTADRLAQMRWQDHRARMLKRDDVLLYYDGSVANGERLQNLARSAAPGSDGRITGAIAVAGRVEGKKAIEFARMGDRVDFHLDLPAQAKSLTIAMWIKVDRFATSHAALLNANGWEPGTLHFQITLDGCLRSGFHSGPAFESPAGTVKQGDWQLVAVTWDVTSRIARLYCDGKPLAANVVPNSTTKIASVTPKLGDCRLGSWKATSAHRPPLNLRDLKGRMDEVMVFDHALPDEEMSALYETGRP